MEKRNPLKIYENENSSIVNLSDGKIPPQAIDLEEAVLGAMLIDEKGVNEIIEILSPGNTQKEMKDKFEVYEEAGIKEYWLVEPNDKAVFVFVLNDQGKYQGLRPKTVDETISSSIFPELTIDLKRVF